MLLSARYKRLADRFSDAGRMKFEERYDAVRFEAAKALLDAIEEHLGLPALDADTITAKDLGIGRCTACGHWWQRKYMHDSRCRWCSEQN